MNMIQDVEQKLRDAVGPLVESMLLAVRNEELNDPILGRLGKSVKKSGVRWTSEYPAFQIHADEFEQLCEFAQRHEQFDQYRERLRGSDAQRDAALMELRVAYFLTQSGFPVVEWGPRGRGNTVGEFSVEGPSGKGVFVEVKNPSWRGEVTADQRKSGRPQTKYIYDPNDGGATDPTGKLLDAIDKAYSGQNKFRDDIPNVLVVADDLFISPGHCPDVSVASALYTGIGSRNGCFAGEQYERLGGVGIFKVNGELGRASIEYEMRLFLNPNALLATALPHEMQECLN